MSRTFLPFVMVPQRHQFVIEKFGKYSRTLEAGLNFKVPFMESVAYNHSLKEQVLNVDQQYAITKDNVKIKIDGILYFRIRDAYKASYSVTKPIQALSLLAQTSMRSEIGKLSLDSTFQERGSLNDQVRSALNEASQKWGIDCMRYEIKDIKPPERIKTAMQLESESERVKRSRILASEGQMQSQINQAEGHKQSVIFEGQGGAEKIVLEAKALTEAIRNIGDAMIDEDGATNKNALKIRITDAYLEALKKIYKEVKIVGLPCGGNQEASSSNALSPENMATAMVMYKQIIGGGQIGGGDMSSADISALQAQISTLKSGLENVDSRNSSKNAGDGDKVRYLDSKTLY